MRESTKVAAITVLAMVLITSNDAILKLVGHSLGLGQLLLIRGFFSIIAFSLIIKLIGRQIDFSLVFSKWSILRALCECGAALLFVYSLSLLSLAVATTLVWIAPIFLTLSSVFIYKEKVGAVRWFSVVLGFTGVLLITRPFNSGFQWEMLLPIGAAFFVLFRDLATKKVATHISSYFVVLATLVMVTMVGGSISFYSWQPIDSSILIWLLFSGTLLSVGFFFNINAVRMSSLSFISPFLFSSILFATFLDYVVWDDIPTLVMSLGIVCIVIAGIATLKSATD